MSAVDALADLDVSQRAHYLTNPLTDVEVQPVVLEKAIVYESEKRKKRLFNNLIKATVGSVLLGVILIFIIALDVISFLQTNADTIFTNLFQQLAVFTNMKRSIRNTILILLNCIFALSSIFSFFLGYYQAMQGEELGTAMNLFMANLVFWGFTWLVVPLLFS